MTNAEMIVAKGGAVDTFIPLVVTLGSFAAFVAAIIIIVNIVKSIHEDL
jgi:hypothetical protein